METSPDAVTLRPKAGFRASPAKVRCPIPLTSPQPTPLVKDADRFRMDVPPVTHPVRRLGYGSNEAANDSHRSQSTESYCALCVLRILAAYRKAILRPTLGITRFSTKKSANAR